MCASNNEKDLRINLLYDTMASFECERCGYVTDTKQHLKSHWSRKKVCKAINSNISVTELLDRLSKKKKQDQEESKKHDCICCKKSFATSWTLSRHEKSCSKQNNLENLELLRRIASTLEALSAKETNVIINHQDNRQDNRQMINNNNTIIVKRFGYEYKDHVLKDQKFLRDCLSKRELGISVLLDRIHFHSKWPCNHNIRYDFGHNQLQIYDGQEWKYHSKMLALNKMILDGIEVLLEHWEDDDQQQYEECLIDKIREFIEEIKLYQDGKVQMNRVSEEVDAMVMNGSKRIWQ